METLTEEDPELMERIIAIVRRVTFGEGRSLMVMDIGSPQLTFTVIPCSPGSEPRRSEGEAKIEVSLLYSSQCLRLFGGGFLLSISGVRL